MHSLLFAAGVLGFFPLPLLLYVPVPVPLTISKPCAESSRSAKSRGAVGGQVRTEKARGKGQ